MPIQARKTSGLRGVPSATETTAEINHLHSRWDKPGSQLYSNPTMAFVPDPSYALGNSGYGYGYGAVMNSTSYSPTPPTKRRSSNKSNARRRRSSCSLSHRKRSSGSNRSFADEVRSSTYDLVVERTDAFFLELKITTN